LDVVEDLVDYVLKGKNQIRELSLKYCNIDDFSLSVLLRNIKHLKSLRRLKISDMEMDSESLLALGNALIYYTGHK
jgi:hypothetical protein